MAASALRSRRGSREPSETMSAMARASIHKGAAPLRAAPALLGLLAAAGIATAAEEPGIAERLDLSRKEIAKLTERIGKLSAEQSSLSQEIQVREAERQLSERRLSEAEASRDDALARHEEAARAAEQAAADLGEARDVLRRRARAAEKVGRPTLLRAMVLAERENDIGYGWQVMAHLVTASASAARRLHSLEIASRELSAREKVRAEQSEVATAEADCRREEAKAARDRAKQIFESVLAEREKQERLLSDELDRARRLEALLVDLEAAALPDALPQPGSKSILLQKGRLPWPAAGPVARGFGRHKHPRFLTITVNSGIEIGAPLGAPVTCIHDGRVVFANWFAGHGNMVIVDHGDKVFSLYGHLDGVAVSVGDEVATGARLADVSDTGSLSGPGLYFEIRRGSQAVDPMEWIQPGPGR